mgnify:FL=1
MGLRRLGFGCFGSGFCCAVVSAVCLLVISGAAGASETSTGFAFALGVLRRLGFAASAVFATFSVNASGLFSAAALASVLADEG